jgi:hypothetical protein
LHGSTVAALPHGAAKKAPKRQEAAIYGDETSVLQQNGKVPQCNKSPFGALRTDSNGLLIDVVQMGKGTGEPNVFSTSVHRPFSRL